MLKGALTDALFITDAEKAAASELALHLHTEATQLAQVGESIRTSRAALSASQTAEWLAQEGATIEGGEVVWPDGERHPRELRGHVLAATPEGERPKVCNAFVLPDAGSGCARCGWASEDHPRRLDLSRAALCETGCVVAHLDLATRELIGAVRGICDGCPLKEGAR